MLYNISFRSIAYLSAVLMKFIVKRRSVDENSVGYHSVIIFKELCSDMGRVPLRNRGQVILEQVVSLLPRVCNCV